MADVEDGGFSLAMPFVVCQTQGGPFDDESFVAGWEMGALSSRLAAAKFHRLGLPHVVIHRANLPQADLLGMNIGAVMEELTFDGHDVTPEQAEEWAIISFDWDDDEMPMPVDPD